MLTGAVALCLPPSFLSSFLLFYSLSLCVYVCAQITVTLAAKGYCWLWQLSLSFRVLYILSLLFYKEKFEAASDIHRDRCLKKRKREAETAYRQNYLLFLYPSALPGCHFTPSLASYMSLVGAVPAIGGVVMLQLAWHCRQHL